jgi:hypothetical protein
MTINQCAPGCGLRRPGEGAVAWRPRGKTDKIRRGGVEKSRGLKDLGKSETFENPLPKRLSKVHNPTGAYSEIK